MRLTIERIRTLVLVCGVLVIVALGVFLAIGRFKSPFSRRDIPKRLGIDIEQEANGVTYTQARGGHTLFKIHASKVVQLKNDHALLHDVRIELYSADGKSVDSIEGDEFEYDQKAGTATAAGPVEMTLMRPGAAPAIASKANPQPEAGGKAKSNPLTAAEQTAAKGEIHVKTSGLTFDQQSGVVTTAQRVDFSMVQGSGSSMGASYDSQQGFLVLDRDVALTVHPTAHTGGDVEPAQIHAEHAEFYSNTNLCTLRAARMEYRGGHAAAAAAQILFRDDGTAVRLEATGGFALATASGGHLSAPAGSMDFDERNQPRHAHLEGGVKMDSVSSTRTVHGSTPTMELEFTPQGELRHAHLERGVELHSEETAPPASAPGQDSRESRTWRSPVADIEFRPVQRASLDRGAGRGSVEPATLHGFGGVVITGVTQRDHAEPSSSRLAADAVTGEFGPDSAISAMTGVGHASMEQNAATGSHETASGDRLEAHFTPPNGGTGTGTETGAESGTRKGEESSETGDAQVQWAVLEGHVVLVEQPAAKPGGPPQAELRATAGRAVYEDLGLHAVPGMPAMTGLPALAGQWLRLTESPRVEDGGLELTAGQIDVAQTAGDAFARGDVKGTWLNAAPGRPGAVAGGPNEAGVALGGQGPAHVIANEVELHQATGEAIFRGNARLWQQADSVSAPVIALDRRQQTLVARGAGAANPVTAVLVTTGGPGAAGGPSPGEPKSAEGIVRAKPSPPSVIRVQGDQLWYSGIERRAVMHSGVLGKVTAETSTATMVSRDIELQLAPPATHGNGRAVTGQVERMTATGHVLVSSQGRRGTGEQLVYTGADGNYRLTGTASAPPEMTDPQRGRVTGEVLIFNSRDDSVSIEGGARETRTETTAPQ